MTSSHSALDNTTLKTLQANAHAAGRGCVVSALIRNSHGQVFAQKRAPNRALFPGCWDLVGGHVDPGETLYDALAREIHEETGWTLVRIVALVKTFDWETSHNGILVRQREFDFLVEVAGDLDRPVIETNKFTEYRWFDAHNVEVLKENRRSGDYAIHDAVKRVLERPM